MSVNNSINAPFPLTIAQGGTNSTSYGANRIIFQNSGNTAFNSIGDLTYNSSTAQLSISTSIANPNILVGTTLSGSANSGSVSISRGDTTNGTSQINFYNTTTSIWFTGMASSSSGFTSNADDLIFRANSGGGGIGNVLFLGQSSGDVTIPQGNLIVALPGKGLEVAHAASGGSATLITGVVLSSGSSGTITNATITTSHIGFTTVTTVSGTATTQYKVTCNSGSFSVTGGSLDNSTLAVLFIKSV